MTYERSIQYSRANRDYDCYVDGRYIGSRPNYSEGDRLCDQIIFDALIHAAVYEPTPPPPDPDPLPEPGPGGPGVPGDDRPRYTRDEAFDKRTGHPEAWRDQFGLVRWVAVGVDPNHS